jgi:hypothetical protein
VEGRGNHPGAVLRLSSRPLLPPLSCVVSARAVPCRAVPCRAVPCRAVPCRAVPCRAVPCRVVSRCLCLTVVLCLCLTLHHHGGAARRVS